MQVLVKFQNNPSNLSDQIILCGENNGHIVAKIISATHEIFLPIFSEIKGFQKLTHVLEYNESEGYHEIVSLDEIFTPSI